MEKLRKNLLKIIKSARFKKITIIIGVIFYLGAFIIAFYPNTFLKFGYPGIFIFSLFGPGMILIPLLAGKFNIFILAFFVALGMAFNDSISWLVGRSGDILIKKTKNIQRIEKTINQYGAYALFFWSLIPFPYDLVGLLAGYLGLSYKKFIFATFLGKFVRFVLLGYGFLSLI